MAYTQADYDNVTAALVALASGTRVVSVTTSDGRNIQYQQADIDKLRLLRNEIASEMQSAAGRRRFVLTSTSKGIF